MERQVSRLRISSNESILKIQKCLPRELGEIHLCHAKQWEILTGDFWMELESQIQPFWFCLSVVQGYELSLVRFFFLILLYINVWATLCILDGQFSVFYQSRIMLCSLTHFLLLSFGRISFLPSPCWTCSTWLMTLLVGVSTWRRITSFTGRWMHLCQHGHDLHRGQNDS